MHRAAIVSGVLGLGSVLVFGAAALAAALFPNGGTVNAGWNSFGGLERGGIAMPAPMPVQVDPGVLIDEGKGIDVPGTVVEDR
jgi:hypothetical protein